MRMSALLAAAASALIPSASSGVEGVAGDDGPLDPSDTGHRIHIDPVDLLPVFDSSFGQTYYPHPHWKGRTNRAHKKWTRAGKPGRGPRGARKQGW